VGRPRARSRNFARAHRDEDAAVTLLNDILGVFDDLGVDRLTSAKLVEELVAMDDAGWAEWRGLEDNQQPRQLSQGELARLLAPFGIRPRTVWPQRRNLGSSRSQKGYLRSQFESTWHKYCDEPDTPSQHNKFSKLRRAWAGTQLETGAGVPAQFAGTKEKSHEGAHSRTITRPLRNHHRLTRTGHREAPEEMA
jgi:hypothetical protein